MMGRLRLFLIVRRYARCVLLRKRLSVVWNGIKPECIMDLFRCSGIRISRIFPWDNWLLTQPTPIRHPWLSGVFSGHPVPKLL